MQVRDKKTLGIDTVFPILLVIIGLALSTVTVFKPGVARLMSPYIYYNEPATPLNLIYNKESYFLEEDVIKGFIENHVVAGNSTAWNIQGSTPIKTRTGYADLLGEVQQFDDYVFDQMKATNTNYFGQFYVNQIQPMDKYQVVCLLNATTKDTVGAWGAFAHESILKQYLNDASMPPASTWNMTIVDQPFPLSKLFKEGIKSGAGTTSAVLMTIAFMMMSDSLVQNIIRERENTIKHQIIVSGASTSAYWLGNYFSDIIFQAIPAVMAAIGVHAFGLDVPGVELLFFAMILANPAFLYFFSFLFDKDDAGSLAIKMVYFLIGVVAPITVSILEIVNPDTKAVGQALRWVFYPIPVFSLCYGYISISQKTLVA